MTKLGYMMGLGFEVENLGRLNKFRPAERV